MGGGQNILPQGVKTLGPVTKTHSTKTQIINTHDAKKEDQLAAQQPVTFDEWQEKFRVDNNPTATVMGMVEVLYPNSDKPDFGMVGMAGKRIGWNRLMQLLWEHSTRPPIGNVISYMLAVQRNNGKPVKQGEPIPEPFASNVSVTEITVTPEQRQQIKAVIAEIDVGDILAPAAQNLEPITLADEVLILVLLKYPLMVDNISAKLWPQLPNRIKELGIAKQVHIVAPKLADLRALEEAGIATK